MLDVDVAVVGAGPAGTAAAITLARAGVGVLVVDRARFPRDKCCGDGLTTLALRQLEQLGLDPGTVGSFVDVEDAWVRSPSGRVVCLPLPSGQGRFAAVATRVDLDAALVDRARVAGADVRDGHRLCGARQTDEAVELDVEGLGTVRARYAIGADGMWSPLRKELGLGGEGYLGEWHAMRQYVTGAGPLARRLWVWFEPDLLPGYAWSFPLPGGRANVGFGIRRDGTPTKTMAATWRSLLERPHIAAVLGPDAVLEASARAWPIPARVDRTVLGAGRVLFAGDAAAATDAMTGEGIGQALLTGILAAETVAAARHGHDVGPSVAHEYRRRVLAELRADHRMSVVLSGILRASLGARLAVRAAGSSAWTRARFARWLFEDEPRAIALTPRRWHRKFLARPGAYAPPNGDDRFTAPTRP